MGIFDSLQKKNQDSPSSETEADSGPVASLQILFAAPFDLDEAAFTRQLRAYDKSLSAAQLSVVQAGEGSWMANISWGIHIVQVVTFGFPMPQEPVEACLQPSHYNRETKDLARTQQAHALLFYRGEANNVSEQYVSLALIAGALCGEGGLAVLNESALTSVPSRVFTAESGESNLELWRTAPPLFLFAGFVKYELEGQPGVWMRTYGLHVWGLPDLATLVEGHHQGTEIFNIFSNVASYMMAKGPILCAGHTMQIGEDIYMKLRDPKLEEAAMGQPNEVLIAEFIRSDQSNPFVFSA
ncbi:DUF4261 domain-containing protein [bacterium]|nr:MAG: DUF4261 domain-containing protein [bacterium]